MNKGCETFTFAVLEGFIGCPEGPTGTLRAFVVATILWLKPIDGGRRRVYMGNLDVYG
jgi:hypothetical protein